MAQVYFINDDESNSVVPDFVPIGEPKSGTFNQDDLIAMGRYLSQRYPEIQPGDVVRVVSDYYFYAGDGILVPPKYAQQDEYDRDNLAAVPSIFSVPTQFPPNHWQLVGREDVDPSMAREVTALFGDFYYIYLPTERPFTIDDLYVVGFAVVIPVNVNGMVYYLAGIHYGQQGLADRLIQVANNLRSTPIPSQAPMIDLTVEGLPADRVIWPKMV